MIMSQDPMMVGVNYMTERYKKNTHIKSKGQLKHKCFKKNSYIFLHNNDCKTPYKNIYIDLLINFNLSVLKHYAYHQISDFEIYTSNNIIAKCIVLSYIISVVSDNILRICIHEPSWHFKDVAS